MKSKIFLLITDDPDDHIVFSSALDEVSTDAVVITIGNCHKAMLILEQSVFVPYCVLINLLMEDANADQILSALGGVNYSDTIKFAFGGEGMEFNALVNRNDVNFLRSSLPYTQLRERFSELLQA